MADDIKKNSYRRCGRQSCIDDGKIDVEGHAFDEKHYYKKNVSNTIG